MPYQPLSILIFMSSIMNRFEAIWFQEYFSEVPVFEGHDLCIYVNDALTEQDQLMLVSYPQCMKSAQDNAVSHLNFGNQSANKLTRVILTSSYLTRLFGEHVTFPTQLNASLFRALLKEHRIRLSAPDHVYYGITPAATTIPKENWTMRLLTKGDKLLFENFCHNINGLDIDNAWVELEHWAVFGLFVNGTLACTCSLNPWDDTEIADIGVLTHPTRRGQGLAKCLIHFAHQQIAQQHYVLQYRTQHQNKASVALAHSLSLQLYALWEPLRRS